MNWHPHFLAICVVLLAFSQTAASTTKELVKPGFAVYPRSSLLVSLLDGSLAGLQLISGRLLWTLPARDGSLLSASQALSGEDGPVIIPSTDGKIVMSGADGMKRFHLDIKTLSMMSHLSSDGQIFVGAHDSTAFNLDWVNGTILRRHSTVDVTGFVESEVTIFQDQCSPEEDDFFETLSGNATWFARKQFKVRVFDSNGGGEAWNMTMTEIDPIGMDNPELTGLSKSGLPGWSFVTGLGGELQCLDSDNDERWRRTFSSPVSSVFVALDRNLVFRAPLMARSFEDSGLFCADAGIGDFANNVYIGTLANGQLYAVPLHASEKLASAIRSSRESGEIIVTVDPADPSSEHSSLQIAEKQSILGLHPLENYGGTFDVSHMLPSPDDPMCDSLEEYMARYGLLRKEDPILLLPAGTGGGLSDGEEEVLPSVPPAENVGITLFVSVGLGAGIATALVVLVRGRNPAPPPPPSAPAEVVVDPATDTMTIHGRLIVNSKNVLGRGCKGTVVYRGSLDGRMVAVKRIVKDFSTMADREIGLLISSDGHTNVVRYYSKETTTDFVYLALELCEFNLAVVLQSMFERTPSLVSEFPPNGIRSFLLSLCNGLAHLHSMNIVHRDLKPANILLARRKLDASDAPAMPMSIDELGRLWEPKISDMGVGKQLSIDHSSFGPGFTLGGTSGASSSPSSGSQPTGMGVAGTRGWQAPELLRLMMGPSDSETELRASRAVDVFSLGCVLYAVLHPGRHPFGTEFERETNILAGAADLSGIADSEAADALSMMLQNSPEDRPSVKAISTHPFFWSDERRLQFLCAFSDRIDAENASSPIVAAFDRRFPAVSKRSWNSLFHAELLEELQHHRKYDFSSLAALIRVMRNKRNHYRDLPSGVRRILPSPPTGFLQYFSARFPLLLLVCYRFALHHFCGEGVFSAFLSPELAPSSSSRRGPTAANVVLKHREWAVSRDVWCDLPSPANDHSWKLPDPTFKSILCKNYSLHGHCRYASKCNFAHGFVELRYRLPLELTPMKPSKRRQFQKESVASPSRRKRR